GDTVETNFYNLRTVRGRVVTGPWAEALANYTGIGVRLVYAERSDADDLTPVTLLSRASLERLGRELDTEIDCRRFRMLFTLDGCDAHEEDGWTRVQIGEAIVCIGSAIGHQVPRCGVITQNPDTGVRSLDALRAIKRYRGRTTVGVPFGVYASIERGGRVQVGDRVEPL
ncbi:MAG: MOSC domain-containing protein, partial [Sciscionella sp.]